MKGFERELDGEKFGDGRGVTIWCEYALPAALSASATNQLSFYNQVAQPLEISIDEVTAFL